MAFDDFNFDGLIDGFDDLDEFAFTSGVMDNEGEVDEDFPFEEETDGDDLWEEEWEEETEDE